MSKVYIYEYLESVSTSWHSEGGAVIITDRTPQEVWHEYFLKLSAKGEYEKEYYIKIAESKLPEANQTIECSDSPEVVTIFKDAGCC